MPWGDPGDPILVEMWSINILNNFFLKVYKSSVFQTEVLFMVQSHWMTSKTLSEVYKNWSDNLICLHLPEGTWLETHNKSHEQEMLDNGIKEFVF